MELDLLPYMELDHFHHEYTLIFPMEPISKKWANESSKDLSILALSPQESTYKQAQHALIYDNYSIAWK